MKKQTFIAALPAILLTAALFVSCSEEKQQRQDAAQYQTMVVGRKDMTLEHQYSARMTGRQIVEVRPQVSGCITRILTGEGEAVRKGQTLFIIDQVPYRAALEMAVAARKSAEARLATAKMNYENEMKLQEGQVVSDMSVETMRNALLEAEAALAQAKAQEVNARNNLSYTEVKSPVNGVASMIPWHVGSLVNSSISEPLVTVADDSEMYVYFSISENQVLNLITQYGSIAEFISKAPPVSLRMNNGQAVPTVSSFPRRQRMSCRIACSFIVSSTARRRPQPSRCSLRTTAANTLWRMASAWATPSLPRVPDC